MDDRDEQELTRLIERLRLWLFDDVPRSADDSSGRPDAPRDADATVNDGDAPAVRHDRSG